MTFLAALAWRPRRVTLKDFELSSRLYSALRGASALDLTVEEFCARFPYSVLIKYRAWKRATFEELVYVLIDYERVLRWQFSKLSQANRIHKYRRELQERAGLVMKHNELMRSLRNETSRWMFKGRAYAFIMPP